jgi:hypothetical protein
MIIEGAEPTAVRNPWAFGKGIAPGVLSRKRPSSSSSALVRGRNRSMDMVGERNTFPSVQDQLDRAGLIMNVHVEAADTEDSD